MYIGTPTLCEDCGFVKYTRTVGHYSLEGFEGDPIIVAIELMGNIMVDTNIIVGEDDICECLSEDNA